MLLPAKSIAGLLKPTARERDDPLVISPCPDIDSLESKASASVDLRLGTWFRTTKARNTHLLDIYKEDSELPHEERITNLYYVPLGKTFILHPNSFVLAVTLEWLRIPQTLAAMVAGKSSWGRRGLLIETAPGVHPGFTGCLTLEVANVGDIPIAIVPGTTICQLFLHKLSEPDTEAPEGQYVGQRQPRLGAIMVDAFVNMLRKNA